MDITRNAGKKLLKRVRAGPGRACVGSQQSYIIFRKAVLNRDLLGIVVLSRSFGFHCAIALALGATVVGAPSLVAAKSIDPARLEACATEAVKWSLLDREVSEPILVDGTSKFHHVRVDGYARHWQEGIRAFVSAPVSSETGEIKITVGYTDPLNRMNLPKDEEKREGMREVLNRCLKGGWQTASRR